MLENDSSPKNSPHYYWEIIFPYIRSHVFPSTPTASSSVSPQTTLQPTLLKTSAISQFQQSYITFYQPAQSTSISHTTENSYLYIAVFFTLLFSCPLSVFSPVSTDLLCPKLRRKGTFVKTADDLTIRLNLNPRRLTTWLGISCIVTWYSCFCRDVDTIYHHILPPQNCYAVGTFPKLCSIQPTAAFLTHIKVIKESIDDNIKTKLSFAWIHGSTQTHTHTHTHTDIHICLYIMETNVINFNY